MDQPKQTEVTIVMIGNVIPPFKKPTPPKQQEEEFKDLSPNWRETIEQRKKTIVEKMERKQTIKKAQSDEKFASILQDVKDDPDATRCLFSYYYVTKRSEILKA